MHADTLQLPDEPFLALACADPAFQRIISPLVSDSAEAQEKGRARKGKPRLMPCGCDSLGGRCEEEQTLGKALERAIATWQAAGMQPGNRGFADAYRPLLRAREAYAAHFGHCYRPAQDGLWQDHVQAAQTTLSA